MVYIDDDASARTAFERAFEATHHIVTSPVSALALRDIRKPAVLAFDAHAVRTMGAELLVQLAAQHPHATRVVIAKPWQPADLAQLLATSCDAWTHSRARVQSLSHDLRTPLMALLSDAEHLSDLAETAPALRDALANVAADMQRAARRIEHLIETLEI